MQERRLTFKIIPGIFVFCLLFQANLNGECGASCLEHNLRTHSIRALVHLDLSNPLQILCSLVNAAKMNIVANENYSEEQSHSSSRLPVNITQTTVRQQEIKTSHPICYKTIRHKKHPLPKIGVLKI